MLNIYLISSAWHFISFYLSLSLLVHLHHRLLRLSALFAPLNYFHFVIKFICCLLQPYVPPLACCALLHQFYWLFPSFHSIECTISLAGVPHAAVSLSAADSRTQLRLQFEHCSCIILVRHAVFGQQSIVFGGTNCCHNLPMNMGVVRPPFPFLG